MTKDNCNVIVDSTLTYRIVDPYVATYLVANLRAALAERTQTTLRQTLGTRMLQECIENRGNSTTVSSIQGSSSFIWH
jgi:regulator of protease activity HflC (stomatin/prohibitin superfamily)